MRCKRGVAAGGRTLALDWPDMPPSDPIACLQVALPVPLPRLLPDLPALPTLPSFHLPSLPERTRDNPNPENPP